MKANELMIGDWVMIENYSKICAIAEDGVYFEDKDGRGATSFDRIEPIPLTAEILEKNGFVEDKKIKCYTYEEGKTLKRLIQIYAHFGDFDCHIVSKNFDADMRLSYVHELQHALKLCGIDKEIVCS